MIAFQIRQLTPKSLPLNLQQLHRIIKLKVISVMMFSSFIGVLITPKHSWSLQKAGSAMIGITLAACGSAALNHLFDRDEDKKMRRTKNRPLAQETLCKNTTTGFAITMITLSMLVLCIFNNTLSAALTLITTLGYSVLYTKILKPTTPQNIVIGGLSGATPPLLGWSAMTGNITTEPLLLVLIIFVWTPAHFWPLAIEHVDDYAKTKWPMLPVTHGISFTKASILGYALLTTACSLMPYCVKMTGETYLAISLILNTRWLQLCTKLWYDTTKAMPLFRFSITYIMVLFVALLLDHRSI